MFNPAHIIYGLLAIAAGVVIIKYNYQLVNMTGRQDWIENKIGSGSTYFVYKIFAVLIIFAGILYVTGLGDGFFTWLFGPLRSIFPKPNV